MAKRTPEPSLKWAKAVKSRDPLKVIGLYHPDAILWATLSTVIRRGHPAIHEYFIGFLTRDSLECTFTDNQVREYGDFLFHSGSYYFTWKDKSNLIRVPARFSFIFKNEGGKWLIVEHHSSLFPELPFKVRKFVVREDPI
jgi:hypothetical protein